MPALHGRAQRPPLSSLALNPSSSEDSKFVVEEGVLFIVLNSVTSPPRWIRQPQLRVMHGACVCVCVCVCVYVCMCIGLASCGCLRPCLFRHLSFLTSPCAIWTHSRRHLGPYSRLHASTSAPLGPSGPSISSPSSTQAFTIHT